MTTSNLELELILYKKIHHILWCLIYLFLLYFCIKVEFQMYKNLKKEKKLEKQGSSGMFWVIASFVFFILLCNSFLGALKAFIAPNLILADYILNKLS